MASISPQMILVLDSQDTREKDWGELLHTLWPGALCIYTTTLHEGLACLAGDQTIDLVCVNLCLPDSTPYQIMEELRSACAVEVPIILISGSDLALEGYDMLRLGADMFCPKGMDRYKMRNRIYIAWAAACGRQKRKAAAQNVQPHKETRDCLACSLPSHPGLAQKHMSVTIY